LAFSLIYSPVVPHPVTIVIISPVKALTAMMVGLHSLSGNTMIYLYDNVQKDDQETVIN